MIAITTAFAIGMLVRSGLKIEARNAREVMEFILKEAQIKAISKPRVGFWRGLGAVITLGRW